MSKRCLRGILVFENIGSNNVYKKNRLGFIYDKDFDGSLREIMPAQI